MTKCNEGNLLLGIDVGTSSVKVSVVSADTQRSIVSVTYPEDIEREIISPQPGWAEQSPELWWSDVKKAILKAQSRGAFDSHKIIAIGITYQMHGLVIVDDKQEALRHSIIWCDGRTEEQAQQGVESVGKIKSLSHLLNFPGNFTASKLAWVKQREPDNYDKIDKFMLPGDFISMKLTGEITSTISMLSEGVFWDFKHNEISKDIMEAFGFSQSLIPEMRPLFSEHGRLKPGIAEELNLPAGIPVCYKAGDQPNNALSLGVFEPGEIATTAGTSGVIYAVADDLVFDQLSRINTFAHVNYTVEDNRLGVLLCINGTGISNRWIRNLIDKDLTYDEINDLASSIPIGAGGLIFLPFGNGVERMLCNRHVGAGFSELDLNIHTKAHMFRAVQEGIAFSFRYGLDIMRANGMKTKVIKAGKANMFLSRVFAEAFVNTTGLTLELYNTDGSVGAALGAGIGLGIYKTPQAAFSELKLIETIYPDDLKVKAYDKVYQRWNKRLHTDLIAAKNNL